MESERNSTRAKPGQLSPLNSQRVPIGCSAVIWRAGLLIADELAAAAVSFAAESSAAALLFPAPPEQAVSAAVPHSSAMHATVRLSISFFCCCYRDRDPAGASDEAVAQARATVQGRPFSGSNMVSLSPERLKRKRDPAAPPSGVASSTLGALSCRQVMTIASAWNSSVR